MSWDEPGFDAGPQSYATAPEPTAAPVRWLWGGLGAAGAGLLIGLLTLLLAWAPQLSAVGWSLGGIVSILLLGAFIHHDTQRRALGWVRTEAAAGRLRVVLVLVAASAVVVNSWVIADAFARREW